MGKNLVYDYHHRLIPFYKKKRRVRLATAIEFVFLFFVLYSIIYCIPYFTPYRV